MSLVPAAAAAAAAANLTSDAAASRHLVLDDEAAAAAAAAASQEGEMHFQVRVRFSYFLHFGKLHKRQLQLQDIHALKRKQNSTWD